MNNSRKLLLILLCTGIISVRADGVLLNPVPAISMETVKPNVAPPMQMESTHETKPTPANQFRRIEKPLGVKVAVTAGGFALIGLELWWFLFSKPKAKHQANQQP